MSFEEIPHTGDLRYRVTGKTREEVFCDAARALFSTMTDLSTVHASQERSVQAEGATPPELLVNFLRACLGLFNVEEFVASTCNVDHVTNGSVTAVLHGERFDAARHPFLTEIKAVTYHGAEFRKMKSDWEAFFTLDL